MKPIYQLSNRDKATLLYQLFPEEMPALIDFIEGMCISVIEGQERERERWDGFIPFDLYLEQANAVADNIRKHRSKLAGSQRLFLEKLFGGFLALFTNNVLIIYVTVRQHNNHKFVQAVELLLKP